MTRGEELRNFLRARSGGGVALAFSGGADSTLLLFLLAELQKDSPFPLLALTMHSVFQSGRELAEAKRTAGEFGVELKVYDWDPTALPELENNPPDRCRRCKRHVFGKFTEYIRERGIAVLMDGTNADDMGAYRPGLLALAEFGVVSPLALLGFTKKEIRALSGELGLSSASKPSASCLATRFEYGAPLTADGLGRVEKGEELIRGYVPEFSDVRLRVHGGLARLEVPEAAMPGVLERRRELTDGLRGLGFEFITLDLEGFRSGCFDRDKNVTTEV